MVEIGSKYVNLMNRVNFGCGLSVAVGWANYDASPTLRLQRLPVFAPLAKALIKPRFSDEVRYGDIVRGLPVATSSVDFIYCSHVLEHLSLQDFRLALAEVLRILKPGAVFRGVLPDLEADVRDYLADASTNACSTFMRTTCLGHEQRPRSLLGRLRTLVGNSHHLWMWDYKGLAAELMSAGFVDVRRAEYRDSAYSVFLTVEEEGRWVGCLGFECLKPGSGPCVGESADGKVPVYADL